VTQTLGGVGLNLTFITDSIVGWPYGGQPLAYQNGKIVWLLSTKPVSALTSGYTFDPATDITGVSSLTINPNCGFNGFRSGYSYGGGQAGPGSGYGDAGGSGGYGGGEVGYIGNNQNGSYWLGSYYYSAIANYYTINSITQFGASYPTLAIAIISPSTPYATNQNITSAAVGLASTKSVSTITAWIPPVIQLSNKTVNAGQVNQSITATISYYSTINWTFDNGQGSVALDSTYSITNVGTTSTIAKQSGLFYESDAGTYTCTITYPRGPPTSKSMVLTVNRVAPVISSITGGGSVNGGVTTTLSTTLSQGSLSITYAWYFKSASDANYTNDAVLGSLIFNQTKSYYVLAPSTFTDSGKYSCIATNFAGSSPAVSATLIVNGLPFSRTIDSQTVLPNTSVQFVCNASGSPPLNYQWNWNGTPITGATSSIYKINTATYTNIGAYTCTVTNSVGATTSNVANLAMFTTESNCLLQANTISSGSGYLSVPPLVITGGSGSGGAVSLIPDRQYIRRIRITGGSKLYTSMPTVTISGGGNVGASAVAITTSVPTDYTIQSISLPPGYDSLRLYPPVTATITGSGSGATAIVETTPYPSGGIAAIRAWSDMNYLSSGGGVLISAYRNLGQTWIAAARTPDTIAAAAGDGYSGGALVGAAVWCQGQDPFRTTIMLTGPTVWSNPYAVNLPTEYADTAFAAAPCYIVKAWQNLYGTVSVTSRDGNGFGCTATLSFQDITSSFYAYGRYPYVVGTPSNGNSIAGYTTVYSPVITITHAGSGYTTAPIFNVTSLQTDTQFGQVQQAWYLIGGGWFDNGGGLDGGKLFGANAIYQFPIFIGAGNSDGGKQSGRPGRSYRTAEDGSARTGDSAVNIMSQELLDFVNGGPLPVAASGGALIVKGVRATSVSLKTIGSGYSPSNTNLVMASSPWSAPPGNYQQSTPIPPYSSLTTTTTPVTVVPAEVDYLLDAIGIVSQGNGFTSTPTVTVGGTGGSCTAVADMSCFAVGSITPANPNTLYTTTPTISITTTPNSANYIAPVVVPVMGQYGTLSSIEVNNPLTNYYPTTPPFGVVENPNDPTYIANQNARGQTGTHPPYSNYAYNYVVTIDPPPVGSAPTAQVDQTSGLAVTMHTVPSATVKKIHIITGASGYVNVPKVSFGLGTVGPPTGYFTTANSNPVRLQAILSRTISQLAVLDNGCGYDRVAMTGNIVKSDGTLGDTIVGSTGYASSFSAAITNPGVGYTDNTSIFKNSKFIQRFDFTTNTGFTSVPTVTSSDGLGSFVATINPAITSGVSLTLRNGGSGYIIYRDPLTNIVHNTASILITPTPIDASTAFGATATPTITGPITQLLLGNLFPANVLPWLPDYHPSWCVDWDTVGSNLAGRGAYFTITKEPGTAGSGLTIVPVVKTAAQLGLTYNGSPISTASYSTTTGQPSSGANWYSWVMASPAQHAADAQANVDAARANSLAAVNAAFAALAAYNQAVSSGQSVATVLAAKATLNTTGDAQCNALAALYAALDQAQQPFPTTYPMGWKLRSGAGYNAYDQGNAWAAAGCPFLTGFAISNAGSGYTMPPKITFTMGVQSVQILTIGSYIQNSISGVTGVNPGINYIHTPTVTIPVDYNSITSVFGQTLAQSACGSGAEVSPSVIGVTANTLKHIFIADQGPGWTGAAPTITVRGPTGATGTATPIMGPSFMKVTMGEGGAYNFTPSVVITDVGTGSGASAVAVMTNIPATSPKAGKKAVSGVMFLSYGSAYVTPQITFVRDSRDNVDTDATAQATMIYDSLWPSIASAVPTDGVGSGASVGLKISSQLCITGVTGTASGVVQIPNTIAGILDGSLSNLQSITSIVFESPSQCTLIGDPVFGNCTSLKSVYLPSSMGQIDSQAFLGCSSLSSVIIEGNTGPRIHPDAFAGCSSDLTVYTPAGFTGFVASHGISGFATSTVTSNLLNSKPNILTVTGTAAYKADVSNTVFNGASITSDGVGNIYGPYVYSSGHSIYSYSLGTANNLINPTPIVDNVPVRGDWVSFLQAVYSPSSTSPAGGVYMLGTTYSAWSAETPSVYYKALDSTSEPVIICNKIASTFKSFTIDNVGNLIFIQAVNRPLLVLSAAAIAGSIASGIPITPIGFSVPNNVNPEVPAAIVCDTNGYVYAALQTAGTIFRYAPYSASYDSTPVLFASGFSQPCALAFDSVGNLYVGSGDNVSLSGIGVVPAGTTGSINTVMNGFFVVPGTLTYNVPKNTLLFSDGYNLCCMPLSGNTTAPVSLIQALSTHDYTSISNITTSVPGSTYILTTADIVSINSTLPAHAQTELPSNEPITYVCPNADQSITIPGGEPNTSAILATSLPPDVSTTVTIGSDTFTVVYNSTTPPTLTISGSGVLSTQTVNVGGSFNTVSGITVTIYSIGLTVFGAVYGAVFVPGVGGTPPLVCKTKKQGIDYSSFLSSSLSNADVQTYKEKGTIDASEWIRRKRMLNSTKFGSC
jgi:hypothetical protein